MTCTLFASLPPGNIARLHLVYEGSTIGPAVVEAGYRLLWSTDGVWYLDGLDVTWQTMYQAEPCTGIPNNLTSLVLGGMSVQYVSTG